MLPGDFETFDQSDEETGPKKTMAHTDTKTKTKTNMRRCTKATREGRSFVINLCSTKFPSACHDGWQPEKEW